jgi:MFS family permease
MKPLQSKLKALAAISSIGIAQLIAWGSLYYAIAVMSDALRRELRLTESELFGAFASSVALSGLLAPWAGRVVDRYGGRVLSAGACFGALGFALLASAHAVWLGLLALVLQGISMALSLYDTCFAALWQQDPDTYRRQVTFVTLVAGLASSVFWPATHYLIELVGWRSTCWVFALLLGVASALNFLAFANPSHERRAHAVVASTTEITSPRGVRWLIAAFAGVSFVSAALSAHLPGTLQALRIDSEVAVWIAATVGVMQVIGRALEFASGRRIPAAKLGLLTFAAVFVSLILLLGSTGKSALALGFALVYGAANGVLTVVGAVLPRELFGTANLGAVLGRFAAPSRIARAVAPWAFSIAASPLGAWGATACVASIAALSLVTYLLVPLTTTQTDARF